MTTSADRKPLILCLRSETRTTSGNVPVLEVSVRPSTWSAARQTPEGCGYREAIGELQYSVLLFADHPEWVNLGELELRDDANVRLADLPGITKKAASIGRAMAKVEATAGPAASFGATVQRFAHAIGATELAVRVDDEWVLREGASIAYAVDAIIHTFRKQHEPQPATA